MEKPSYASRVPARVLKAHVVLGALQLSIGVLAIAFSIVGAVFGLGASLEVAASGIWSAPFFIAAGVSGLVAGKSEKRCTLGCVVTCLVFSVIASVFSASALIQEAIVTATNSASFQSRPNRCRFVRNFKIAHAMGILCCLLFTAEFVLAIVHSAFACRASCCCVPSAAATSSQQQPQQPQHPAGPQFITIVSPDGQQQEHEVVFITAPEFEPQPAFNPTFQQQQPQVPTSFQQVLPNPFQQPPSYDEQQTAGPSAHEMKQALP